MPRNSRLSRFAVAGFGLIAVTWLWLGVFAGFGMNHLYAASWWIQTIRFGCYALAALAVLFAVGGLIFDRGKILAGVALGLSLASFFFVFYLRP